MDRNEVCSHSLKCERDTLLETWWQMKLLLVNKLDFSDVYVMDI